MQNDCTTLFHFKHHALSRIQSEMQDSFLSRKKREEQKLLRLQKGRCRVSFYVHRGGGGKGQIKMYASSNFAFFFSLPPLFCVNTGVGSTATEAPTTMARPQRPPAHTTSGGM